MAAPMARRFKKLDLLKGEQLRASDPADLIWLSASAGTGKTHVLTARVLRLLLHGVRPDTILCLTFTKAGAAEMADRIHARLAHWVTLDADRLKSDLFSLGEEPDPQMLKDARRLFARVLDAPGGGLRIQTIHAFCQTLLGGFPSEAGLTPGFRPLEGREEAALARRTLADMLADAERGGDLPLIRDVQALSRRLGEARVEAYLMACARAPDAMAALGAREGIEARLKMALDVPLGDVEQVIEAGCADDAFDLNCVRVIARANADWGTKTGVDRSDRAVAFILASPARRVALLQDVIGLALTKAGEPLKHSPKIIDAEPRYVEHCERLVEQVQHLIDLRLRAALATLLAAGLRAGQTYSTAYVRAKLVAGVVDFDDLIRKAVALLRTPGMGDWVRYKLDQATDHILVDEAQDTNTSQWAIVAELAGEFFAGEGARGSMSRTIFTVGDFKQAIFGFQGTDPIAFAAARVHFGQKAADAGRDFIDLSLDRSFRSTPPVLELVDRIVADLGGDQLGLTADAEPHRSARAHLPGQVTLWKPTSIALSADVEDEGEEGWIDDATRGFATKLAKQVRHWIDSSLWMAGKGRPIRPEDILILVRRRASLASLIVARLHAEGVAVAGVDRLRLTAPLAVKDLLAAARFAVQRDDDLSLASLLVSPLFGWSQDELYHVGFRRKGSLIDAVRASGEHAATLEGLDAILARADFTTPYRFLEHILTGPIDGRRKLMRRLGVEARDPIEELLNAALQFESTTTASLQRFLDWFDRGDVEITRDPSAPMDAVRVMTVHGSKGLQAPMVILADATGNPDTNPASILRWQMDETGHAIPIFRPRKTEMVDALRQDADALKTREMQEHWRLLYVAMTRAEEHLVIGGALGVRARGVPPANSWYQVADTAMAALGCDIVEDPIWESARHFHGIDPMSPAERKAVRPPRPPVVIAEPAWLRAAAPVEARPPRPLAPSAIGRDDVADPPPSPGMRAAARRGTLLHSLFERLPAIDPLLRAAAAEHWLARSAGVADEALRLALVEDACAIIADPAFADIFSRDALAEAPIAAVVGGDVVAGTVDRLLVTADRVVAVDFKTGRRVPEGANGVPRHHLLQMVAYAAALEIVFPGRVIEAALLYTSGPKLIRLPETLLSANKPGLGP
jgi:ATP-dependent helicase/nuclease subunit A